MIAIFKMQKNLLLLTILFYLIPFFTYSITTNKWEINLLGSKLITYEDNNFGGISGITLSENGENFTLISDKSYYFKGRIVRDNLNKIIDFEILDQGQLFSSKKENLTGRNIDSESIVRIKGNGFYISFESNN